MKKELIIFGAGDIAELAHFYFNVDTDYKIAAFTIDAAYMNKATFKGLPVVPFEHLAADYPSERYDVFIALSYSKINAIRKEKYFVLKAMGYTLASYVSQRATVLNENKIGENCFILEDNTIQPFVSIGNNVTLWSGNHIGHHSIIHDHCFIASHVVISGGVEIGEQCFIGVNATLRDHIKIGSQSVIGAGTLILRDAEPNSLYIGSETHKSAIESQQLKTL